MQHTRAFRRASTALVTVATGLAVGLGTAGSASADSLGVDVSSWQHSHARLDWARVKADGNTFAFIKATEGTGYVNPYFRRDWADTGRAGLFRGAYHFALPHHGTARAQARFFVRVAGHMDAHGDLPPVLDLEVTGGLHPHALRAWTRTWLQTVSRATGRRPIVYTSPAFWRSALGNTRQFAGYPLWIAHYGVSNPQVPGGWRTWTFWQGSRTSRVPGIGRGVDRNAFNGSMGRLRVLARAAGGAADGRPQRPQPHRRHQLAHQQHSHQGQHRQHRRQHGRATGIHVRLQAAADAVVSGGKVKLYGHLTTAGGRPVTARRVRIYRRPVDSRRWTRVDVVKSVAPTGWYQTYVQPDQGTLYRAVFRGGPQLQHTGSVRVRVRVPSRLTVSRLTRAAEIPPVG